MDNNINKYILSRRGVGHTKLLIEGAKNFKKPFFIVGADTKHVSRLREELKNTNAIPVSLMGSNHVLHGVDHPMIIDNHTYSMTCENYEQEIDGLKREMQLVKDELTVKSTENIGLRIIIMGLTTFTLIERIFMYKGKCKSYNKYL